MAPAHVPGLDSPCRSADGGGEVPLGERILLFLDRAFGPEARTPAPEIRPGLRVFAQEVTVPLRAPDSGIAISYTTGGSAPTAASPRFAGPFALRERTVVTALATMPGRRASGVATAIFIPGPVPPRIASPATAAGCSPLRQADGAAVLILVPAAERATAQPIVERARR